MNNGQIFYRYILEQYVPKNINFECFNSISILVTDTQNIQKNKFNITVEWMITHPHPFSP